MEKTLSTKNIVLKELNKGEFVSGERLADIAGVSRTAIWKAVRSLRKEGYLIDAITNKGYCISKENDVMTLESLKEALSHYFDEDNIPPVWYFDSIDSTNNELKRMAASCGAIRNAAGDLTTEGIKYHKGTVIAASQTAGKGRLGRSFYSPDKSGVYMSLMYAPKGGIKEPALFTSNASIAVCRALSSLYGLDPKIKWVNDIFVNEKKVCGILTEGVANFESGIIEAAIVGIGINISNGKGFPEEIASVAGSLLGDASITESKREKVTRSELVACVIANLLAIYDAEEAGDKKVLEETLAEYRKRSILIGKTVKVIPVIGNDKSSYEATVLDIDAQAGLVVRLEDGSAKVLKSGEVSLKSANFSKHCDI